MFESPITNLIPFLFQGGSQGVIALMILVIVLLLLDRRRIHTEFRRKEDKLDKVIEDYYRGNVSLAEAMTALKSVLFEIRNKI